LTTRPPPSLPKLKLKILSAEGVSRICFYSFRK
jgi:hypothetical protein